MNVRSSTVSHSLFLCFAGLAGLAGLATDASAQIVPGTNSVVYSINDVATTFSGSSSTSLADLERTDVVEFSPFVTLSAESVLTNATLTVLMGDEDGDGDFDENFVGDIDALDVLRIPAPPAATRTVYSYVFSTAEDFGQVLDGDVFRFLAGGAAGDSVQRMLKEGQVLLATGQNLGSGDVDVDSFTQDQFGNIYLSFADDEDVNGTLLSDGGVCMIPSTAITYGPHGNATNVVAGSAVIILSEADVDAMVATAGLLFASTVDDTTCLAIDLLGGTFVGRDGLNHPNLYFSGESLGASVLSTAAGGSFATGNFGAPLATPTGSPGALGLGAMSGGIDALTVRENFSRALAIDSPDTEVIYPGETHVEWNVGNCVPNSIVTFFIDVFPGVPGAQPTSQPVFGKVFPQIYPFPVAWNLVFFLPSDANGVATITGTLTHSVSPHFFIGQAYDPGNPGFGFPEQLGAPGGIWFP